MGGKRKRRNNSPVDPRKKLPCLPSNRRHPPSRNQPLPEPWDFSHSPWLQEYWYPKTQWNRQPLYGLSEPSFQQPYPWHETASNINGPPFLLPNSQFLYPESVQVNYSASRLDESHRNVPTSYHDREPYYQSNINGPSPSQNRIPVPSPSHNRIPVPSPSQNRIPVPSPLQNRIHVPSPLQNRIPVPSPLQPEQVLGSAKHHDRGSTDRSNAMSVSANSSTTFQSSLNTVSSISNTRVGNDLDERQSLRKVEINDSGGLRVQVGNGNPEEEDVQFLYSVNPKEGKLVELVDLSMDLQVDKDQDLVSATTESSYVSENSSSKCSDSVTPINSTCGDSTVLVKAVKNIPRRQSASADAYCINCNKSYKELLNNKSNLYSARCGHLFCGLCIKRSHFKIACRKCKKTVSGVWKIVL